MNYDIKFSIEQIALFQGTDYYFLRKSYRLANEMRMEAKIKIKAPSKV